MVSILIENWKFDQTSSEKNAYHMGTSFLNFGLAHSSYTEVAEVDGEVVGMLANSFGKVPLSSRLYLLNVLLHGIPLLLPRKVEIIYEFKVGFFQMICSYLIS